jgi:chromosome segregation ATPase
MGGTMLLYNQIGKQIDFELEGKPYMVDPWGSVNVPDQWVETCRRMKLPLGQTSVAPDRRAASAAAEAEEKARQDEILKLRTQLESALSQINANGTQTGAVKAQLSEIEAANADLKSERLDFVRQVQSLSAERDALTAQLQKMATEKAELERKLGSLPKPQEPQKQGQQQQNGRR